MADRKINAEAFLQAVFSNDVPGIETLLKQGDKNQWRNVIRSEFPTDSLLCSIFAGNKLLMKLAAYEIRSSTCLHLAAMLGYNDVVVNILDLGVPEELALQSGSTSLHIAAFSGHLHTVKLLLDVYHANPMANDRYGWSTLHYASSEGHLPIVQELVSRGLDINHRDQDGTTPAFRAQTNNHLDVVQFYFQFGDPLELLQVDSDAFFFEMYDVADGQYAVTNNNDQEPVYAKINKNKKATVKDVSKKSVPKAKPTESLQTISAKAQKHGTLRRILRSELEKAFFDDDYLTPDQLQELSTNNSFMDDSDKITTLERSRMSVGTLKGIFRDELDRYRRQMIAEGVIGNNSSQGDDDLKSKTASAQLAKIQADSAAGLQGYEDEDEDPYDTLDNLPPPPIPPAQRMLAQNAPVVPLRPTSFGQDIIFEPESPLIPYNQWPGSVTLKKNESNTLTLNSVLQSIAPQIGKNWKKLAHALPLENDPAKINSRVKEIEKHNKGSTEKQTLATLTEWRINKGKEANLDTLSAALKKCGLNDAIAKIEDISHEFSA